MKRVLIVRFFLGVGLLSLSLGPEVAKAEGWRPSSVNFQTKENRDECSVYRSVFTTTKEALGRRMGDRKELTQSTKGFYEKLKDCQKKHGLDSRPISDVEGKLAQLCSESYDSWLVEGTRLLTVEDDIERLKEEVSTLQGAVSRKCVPVMIAELK